MKITKSGNATDQGVALLEFAHIEFDNVKANSFTQQMLEDLAKNIIELGSEVKVIIIRSAGEKTFSAAGANGHRFCK